MADNKKIDVKVINSLNKPERMARERQMESAGEFNVEREKNREKEGPTEKQETPNIQAESLSSAIPSGSIIAPGRLLAEERQLQKQIEQILASGLEKMYLELTPDKQREFKKLGEQTASKISRLLHQTKVKAREIIKLIKQWLSLIPGINKYFLEQEAKIKADDIMRIKK